MSTFSTADLVRGLDGVADEMKRDVGALIPVAAQTMEATLKARYPIGRKHNPAVPRMREDIRIRTFTTNDVRLPGRRVVGPRLAYIWQDGTRERLDSTRKNARRGRMPAADPNFFERTATRTRADMMARAQDILNRPRTIG